MSYIEVMEVVKQDYTCSHPRVAHFFMHGGMPFVGTTITYVVCIITTDGDRHDFGHEFPSEAIQQAEDFLKTL